MHESDPFYKYLMKPCNITKNDVEAVIASADHKHKFEGNNLTKLLFIKHMPKDYFLLVDVNLKDGHHSIQTVFRMFPHTIRGKISKILYMFWKILPMTLVILFRLAIITVNLFLKKL
jgi:hypothetical protein